MESTAEPFNPVSPAEPDVSAGTPEPATVQEPSKVPYVRVGWAAGLLVVFLIVAFRSGDAPSTSLDSWTTRELVGIQADASANNTQTQGAPQQQVVNGWQTNDLLTLSARQAVRAHQEDLAMLTTFKGMFITLGVWGLGEAILSNFERARRPRLR